MLDVPPTVVPRGMPRDVEAPPGTKIHINEVIRAAVNRKPQKIQVGMEKEEAEEEMKPLLMLCQTRGIRLEFSPSSSVPGRETRPLATVYFVLESKTEKAYTDTARQTCIDQYSDKTSHDNTFIV